MNKGYLMSSLWRGTYLRSPFTQASYYAEILERNFEIWDRATREKAMKEDVKGLAENGYNQLLPYRIGILQGESCREINKSGRGSRAMDAQLKGAFTRNEVSPYKKFPKYEVQTALWRVDGYQTMYYGSIGITGQNGKIDRDNGDLLIMRTEDFNRVEIFLFRGLAGPHKHLTNLDAAISCVKGIG